MHNRHTISPFLRLLAVLFLCATTLGLAQAAAAQGPNLLVNPGFEGDYAPFSGDVRRLVAPGWSAWNVPRRAGEPSWSNIAPQYLPADVAAAAPGRVRSGRRAQEFYELYATFTGGVYQQVSVAPGTPVQFSAWINVWSTELDNPAASTQPGGVVVQVGIDPAGGTNGESTAIVWGSSQQYYDEYRLLTVDAVAAGGTVTVFVRAIMLDPVRHNHIYVDDATLSATGGATTPIVPPTTVPPPTQVPPTLIVLPTATPTPTPLVPTPFVPPTFTPTLDPFIPTREGTIIPVTPGTPGTPVTIVAPTREPGIGTPSFPDLPGRVTHTVRSGDTVGALALRYNSRIDAIIALNNLRADGLIVIGQQLTIPVPAAQPATIPPPVTTLPPLFPSPTNTLTFATPSVGGSPVDTAVLNGPTVNGIGTYIMQAGDTFEAVARRYRVTAQQLAALNGIVNPSRVVIGQVLAVPGPGNNRPGGTVAPTVLPTQPGGGAQPGAGTHVVQRGENLFRISLRYNVSIAALMQANGILNPNLIYAGQVLRIP
jgi:LysM repeat protein